MNFNLVDVQLVPMTDALQLRNSTASSVQLCDSLSRG